MELFPSINQSPCYNHWCCAPLDDPFPPSDDVTSSDDDVTIPSSDTSASSDDISDTTTDDDVMSELERERFTVQEIVITVERSTYKTFFSFPLLQMFCLNFILGYCFLFRLLFYCCVEWLRVI